MLVRTCDACGATIADDAGYFGVDSMFFEQTTFEPDDGVQVELATLTVGTDHEFHFCASGCLATWSMSRALDDE